MNDIFDKLDENEIDKYFECLENTSINIVEKPKKKQTNRKFKVGKSYECANNNFHPIRVLQRFDNKHVSVTDGEKTWVGKIRYDDEGDEYIRYKTHTTVTMTMGIYTYSSAWEI